MRSSLWIAAGLLATLASAAPAQEERCCGVKERAVAAGKSAGDWEGRLGPVRPWPDYDRHIRWYESIEEGQRQAVAQGKLLFTLQIVGNLKDEGC